MDHSTNVPEAAKTAMNKAKIALMSRADSAFFTTLAFSLKHEFDDRLPTAATNGTYIKYNPDFFMSLTPNEQVFLMLHEAMHCAYLHMDRVGDRCPDKFNIAADHVINLQLIDRGFNMPEGGLADFQYRGMSTEEVYNLLPPSPSGGQQGVPGFGADLHAPDSKKASEALKNEMQDILVRAALQSKMAGDKPGSIPGEIQLFLDSLLDPKLPWNHILQKYLQTFSKNDYSFKRFNRRFFPDHYLPSLYSENLMDIAAFADISGSVSDHEFHTQLSEVASIMRMMKPSKISFGQFDTEIKSIDVVRSLADMKNITFTGRGGTDVKPVIDWTNTNKPQLLLIFTDGEFRFPAGMSTKIPVIWLIYNNKNFKAPFGKIIHYEIARS